MMVVVANTVTNGKRKHKSFVRESRGLQHTAFIARKKKRIIIIRESRVGRLALRVDETTLPSRA